MKKKPCNTTIKKLLTFFTAFILSAYSYAQPPYTSNDQALFGRALGYAVDVTELPTHAYLWNQGMNFTCWNGDLSCTHSFAIGSKNHPVIAEEGHGNYQWVAALCRYEKQHGIWGRELGAPAYYYANVIAPKMTALRDARAAGDYSAAKDIAESLRCVWAFDALTAIATPRVNAHINIAGQITNNAGDAAFYNGLTCATAGDRWHTEANINHDAHGEYLSWALDWQGRSVSPVRNLLTSNGKWWQEITAQLGGKAYYTQSMDPEVFGLNATDRQKLIDVVNGDVNAAKWAAQVVAGFGTWKDPNVNVADCYVKMRLRRTSLGTETVYFNSTNGNKPTQAAAQIFFNGDYYSIRPAFYHGVGANHGYSCWVANGLIQADCPGDGAYVSIPEMGGSNLWQVDIDGSSIIFNGVNLSGAAPANYPATQDVGVTAILAPTATLLNDTVTPKVTIKNYGSTTVNNVYISFTLNGGLTWVTTWRGTLAAGASTNVFLHQAPVSQGTYTLVAYTGGPNYEGDSNTANDSHTMVFNVSPSTQTIDAGISAIVNPTSSITADSILPIAKLRNFGQANLTSAYISYKLDNGNAVTLPWTGSLAPAATFNFSFPKIPIAPGTHTLQVYSSQPNGQADANASNDSKTLVFNVISPYLTDVEAVAVSQPLTNGCATNIQPQLVIQNLGPVQLFQISINYRVDANSVVSATYTVPIGSGLLSGASMAIFGAATTVGTGVHTLKMWVSNPNNVGDLDNSNDTLMTAFTVATSGQSLPFSEDFENITPGLIPATWTLFNADAFDEWFVYATQNNKAAALNNHDYANANNTKDELLMPVLDLTGNSQAWLSFDYSHSSQPNATKFDSLEVLISTDCGTTYTSVWSKGGTSLNTVPDQSAIFIPTGPQDYLNAQVNLSAYTSFTEAIIKFINWSNMGNSTLVDNVNVTTTQSSAVHENNSASAFQVFPVPASDFITVAYQLQKQSDVKIQLVNALGEIVESKYYGSQNAGKSLYQFDLSQINTGMYQLIISSGEITKSKKISVVK